MQATSFLCASFSRGSCALLQDAAATAKCRGERFFDARSLCLPFSSKDTALPLRYARVVPLPPPSPPPLLLCHRAASPCLPRRRAALPPTCSSASSSSVKPLNLDPLRRLFG